MLEKFLRTQYWNNSIKEYLIFFLVIFFCIFIIKVFNKTILKQIKKLALKTKTDLDDQVINVLSKNLIPALYLISIYFSFSLLEVKESVFKVVHILFVIFVSLIFFRFIISLINLFVKHFLEKNKTGDYSKNYRSITTIISIVIWVMAILFILNNFGFNVTTVVAGLGIGGIAIALAAQAILGDLISYFVILLDKPFKIGDFISIDDKSGTIDDIGIKTTRIKSLRGELIIIPNSEITKARIHNFDVMDTRRHSFLISIKYETEKEKLNQIPGLIKSVIENVPRAKFERVGLREFGPSSYNYEIIYYVNLPSYVDFLEVQDEVCNKIIEILDKEKISLAYPVQRILLDTDKKNN